MRRWSKVVVGQGTTAPTRPPQVEWEPGRSVFLIGKNTEEARKPIPSYGFGHSLQACFASMPGLEMTMNPTIKRIE